MAKANEWLQSTLSDSRFTFRQLRKSPVFAIVVILTLALGIGANTIIFTVVQNVLLAPLPFQNPDRLVVLWENNPRFERTWVSYPNFLDWQRTARSLHEMAAFLEQGVNLTAPGAPEHLISKQISFTFFSTLGVQPILGRGFSVDEDKQGGTPVAVISHQLWRTRFASSPNVLGATVTLNGVDYTIVGVAPQKFELSGNSGFRLQGDTQVYTPLGQADPLILNDRSAHSGIFAFARLEAASTLPQSQAEMSTIQNRLDRLYPGANRDIGMYLEPLKRVIVGDVGRILLLLLGAVGLVLLVACANVANLLLSRGAVRAREFAIRSALGADRRRIVQQLLTESVLLSLTGAGLGLLIAAVGLRPLLATLSIAMPRSAEIAVNANVLVFTVSISVLSAILFGIAPALKNSQSSPQHDLKAGERGSTTSHHRIQSTLVITQMALTVVLLAGAGLLLRSIRHLSEVNPGFDTERVVTFKVGVSPSLLTTAAATRATYQQLLQRIRDIPGVQGTDFTEVLPLSDSGIMPFWINSQKPPSIQAAPRLAAFLTGPDYLQTMGIPLLRGRFFTAQDTTQSPCVAVIDSVFAKMYFKDSDPLNQTISAGFATFGPCRIVGVVGHVKEWSLDESSTDIQNQAYFALYQDPDRWVPVNYPDTTIVVSTRLDFATLMPLVKSAVYGVATDQPIYNVRTMRQIVSDSMSAQRFPMALLSAFAVLALFMASIGVYGVISYSTSQRLREIGIRMALGAERRSIFQMVVGYGLRLTIVGLLTGVAAAVVLLRLLSSFSQLLSGVAAYDPVTFGSIFLLLTVVAFLACYLPARRAMNVDPLVILRYE